LSKLLPKVWWLPFLGHGVVGFVEPKWHEEIETE